MYRDDATKGPTKSDRETSHSSEKSTADDEHLPPTEGSRSAYEEIIHTYAHLAGKLKQERKPGENKVNKLA